KTGKGPCSHFELRFTGAAACRRAGLDNLNDLARGINALKLAKHQTRVAFIDGDHFDRTLRHVARNVKWQNRLQFSNTMVREVKQELRRRLTRILQDETFTPDENKLTKVRSQTLWDHRKSLRHCLTEIAWDEFPTPRW